MRKINSSASQLLASYCISFLSIFFLSPTYKSHFECFCTMKLSNLVNKRVIVSIQVPRKGFYQELLRTFRGICTKIYPHRNSIRPWRREWDQFELYDFHQCVNFMYIRWIINKNVWKSSNIVGFFSTTPSYLHTKLISLDHPYKYKMIMNWNTNKKARCWFFWLNTNNKPFFFGCSSSLCLKALLVKEKWPKKSIFNTRVLSHCQKHPSNTSEDVMQSNWKLFIWYSKNFQMEIVARNE